MKEIIAYRDKLGYLPAVFLDDNPKLIGSKKEGIPVEGPISILYEIVKEYNITHALITMPSVSGDVIRKIVKYCQQAGIFYRIVPPTYRNLQFLVLKHLEMLKLKICFKFSLRN